MPLSPSQDAHLQKCPPSGTRDVVDFVHPMPIEYEARLQAGLAGSLGPEPGEQHRGDGECARGGDGAGPDVIDGDRVPLACVVQVTNFSGDIAADEELIEAPALQTDVLAADGIDIELLNKIPVLIRLHPEVHGRGAVFQPAARDLHIDVCEVRAAERDLNEIERPRPGVEHFRSVEAGRIPAEVAAIDAHFEPVFVVLIERLEVDQAVEVRAIGDRTDLRALAGVSRDACVHA